MLIFERLLRQDPDEHILTYFLEYFKDAEKIKTEVLDFYYPNVTRKKGNIGAIIKSDQELSDRLKFALFDFSMNPADCIAKLKKNLKKYYEEAEKIHTAETVAIEEGMAIVSEAAIDQIVQTYSLKPLNEENITYSITVIMKDMVAFDREYCLLIVGKSFLTCLEKARVQEKTDLALFKRSDIMGDGQRFLILEILLKNQKKGMTVGELAEKMNTVVSSLQHHLRKMIETGFLVSEKRGQKRFYYVNLQVFIRLGEIMNKIGKEGKMP